MPEFMDVHHNMKDVTQEQLQAAHDADLAIQDDEGVNFKQAWEILRAGWCSAYPRPRAPTP